MADNYLERKMEDLRRGPVKSYSGRPSAHRTGYIQFPFPPKRVIIASDLASLNSIAKAFLKADCKVAVMNSNREVGEKMAHDEGIRYYPVHLDNINELSPFSNEDLEKAFENLLEAWRDVDILIADSPKRSQYDAVYFSLCSQQLFTYMYHFACSRYISL